MYLELSEVRHGLNESLLSKGRCGRIGGALTRTRAVTRDRRAFVTRFGVRPERPSFRSKDGSQRTMMRSLYAALFLDDSQLR